MKRISIITDSRGRYFQQHFNYLVDLSQEFEISVMVYKGRELYELWIHARSLLLKNEIDHAYLLGGICNLTTPFFQGGRRYFWPGKNLNVLTNNLMQQLIDISVKVRELKLDGMVTILPEIGADLLVYNRTEIVLPWMNDCQQQLDHLLPSVHNATRRVNESMGTRSTWYLDSIYKRTKKGVLYPRYSLLEDGLHPADSTALKMVACIAKDIRTLSNYSMVTLHIILQIILPWPGLYFVMVTYILFLIVYVLHCYIRLFTLSLRAPSCIEDQLELNRSCILSAADSAPYLHLPPLRQSIPITVCVIHKCRWESSSAPCPILLILLILKQCYNATRNYIQFRRQLSYTILSIIHIPHSIATGNLEAKDSFLKWVGSSAPCEMEITTSSPRQMQILLLLPLMQSLYWLLLYISLSAITCNRFDCGEHYTASIKRMETSPTLRGQFLGSWKWKWITTWFHQRQWGTLKCTRLSIIYVLMLNSINGSAQTIVLYCSDIAGQSLDLYA